MGSSVDEVVLETLNHTIQRGEIGNLDLVSIRYTSICYVGRSEIGGGASVPRARSLFA